MEVDLTGHRFTAAEIARMQIPGLPTSKAAVAARADREKWEYTETKGVGGLRRLFKIPQRYVDAGGVLFPHKDQVAPPPSTQKANSLSDAELVQEVVMGVEKFLANNELAMDPERKATLVSLLFRYFREEGSIDGGKLDALLRNVA